MSNTTIELENNVANDDANIKVKKRNSDIVDFDTYRIKRAIEKAMENTSEGIDEKLSNKIAEEIKKIAITKGILAVEEIQDLVEEKLMDKRKDVAKKYIIYRYQRSMNRNEEESKGNFKLLTDDYISSFKHKKSPMNQLGNFVYYRTYSRFIDEEKRREYWWETVRRAVEYNCNLVPNVSKKEAEKLFQNVFELKQFLSGRTFWVGGTPVAYKYPISNYNCAFTNITNFEDFAELFYLLMIGSGVGVSVLREHISKLPKIRTDIYTVHTYDKPIPKGERIDHSSLRFFKKNVEIIVGDSKEGWMESLEYFFKIHYSKEYRDIDTIIINYNNVRPKGEKLNTFGGTASGHESLKNMFTKIDKVLQSKSEKWAKLKPIDCLDIANIIGENVVSGGVRRTAEIVLMDSDDEECIQAKSNMYTKKEDKWILNEEIAHRQMSNNSIYYKTKPTREQLHWHLQQMRYSGEPGWVNAEAASKRRENMNGVNPCGEILLDSKGLCNLVTNNVYAFVENGKLNKEELFEAIRLSVRAAVRMTCVELELHQWDYVQSRDRIIGCSLTGWQDMVNAVGLTKEQEASLLRELREVVHEAGNSYAEELRIDKPILMTTVKPEGTLSQLPGVSSGIHYSHSPYYIRRVRISAHDPLAKVALELGWPVFPEVGQTWENAKTYVVEFPERAPEGKTKYDVSAIEQLENYKMFMANYVDHNCSITIHVRENEWDAVEEWVWNNWDDTVALSFLSLDDSYYELLPYESITKEEYEKRLKEMAPFDTMLIRKHESRYKEYELESDCAGGACPVR